MILETCSKLEILKKERNVIILAHYYQDPNIHDVADFMGVSLGLSKQSTQTNTEKFINSRPHDEKIIIPLLGNDGCACNKYLHLRLNTLEKMVEVLEKIKPEITLPEDLHIQALMPLEKMLALS